MEHGMVDMVVSRLDMKKTIANLLKILLKVPAEEEKTVEPEILPPAVVEAEAPRPSA
jgi:acetyl-CoA carboxylase carboxyl transferase subunit beta